jgi:uncharacterized protein (TIGR00661 family)
MKILFGVFDWGLGHATRDTPLIEELLNEKHEVHIISTGNALKLLKERFKNRCIYHEIPSLFYMYGEKGNFQLKFLLKLPSLAKSLYKARKATEEIINENKFDKVISDCRYDVYDKPENSYLINHQLRFKAPYGTEWILELWLASRMKKYKCVIVPDYEEKNLSGNLSHDLRFFKKDRIRYIGIFSHIKKLDVKEDIDYFISLSGPEKTRIELEDRILSQVKDLNGKIVITGGDPNRKVSNTKNNITFYSFLNREKQEEMMNRSKFIVIRGGYTTIMELVEIGKKALLIPSPGQTEQEYLGDYLEKEKYFHHVDQKELDLKKDIKLVKESNGFSPQWKTKESVKKFMKIIKDG